MFESVFQHLRVRVEALQHKKAVGEPEDSDVSAGLRLLNELL